MIKLDKNRSGNESKYMHICDNLSEKKMRTKGIEILISDIHIYTFVFNNDKKSWDLDYIKFCPYCGCDLEKELNKFYE